MKYKLLFSIIQKFIKFLKIKNELRIILIDEQFQ